MVKQEKIELIKGIMFLILVFLLVIWTFTTIAIDFNKPYLECQNQSDSYQIFKGTEDQMTCGELRNITTMEGYIWYRKWM